MVLLLSDSDELGFDPGYQVGILLHILMCGTWVKVVRQLTKLENSLCHYLIGLIFFLISLLKCFKNDAAQQYTE